MLFASVDFDKEEFTYKCRCGSENTHSFDEVLLGYQQQINQVNLPRCETCGSTTVLLRNTQDVEKEGLRLVVDAFCEHLRITGRVRPKANSTEEALEGHLCGKALEADLEVNGAPNWKNKETLAKIKKYFQQGGK